MNKLWPTLPFTRASELDGESLDILNERVQARWWVNMHDPRLEPLLKCLMAQSWADAYVQLTGLLWRRQG